jgi:hypothetical protein
VMLRERDDDGGVRQITSSVPRISMSRARIFVGRCERRRYDGGIAATGGIFFPRITTWPSRTD